MVQVPETVAPATTPEAMAAPAVVETKKKRKDREAAKKAAALAANPPAEGAAPPVAETKAPAVPKVKGPNDLSGTEARVLAILAGGNGMTNGEIWLASGAGSAVIGSSKPGSNGLVGRGMLECKMVEGQNGARSGNRFFITPAGRAALDLLGDVTPILAAAAAAGQKVQDKVAADKALAADKKAAAVTVPVAPVAAPATDAPVA